MAGGETRNVVARLGNALCMGDCPVDQSGGITHLCRKHFAHQATEPLRLSILPTTDVSSLEQHKPSPFVLEPQLRISTTRIRCFPFKLTPLVKMRKPWDDHKELIIVEYKENNKSLHEVRRIMEQRYGFKARYA